MVTRQKPRERLLNRRKRAQRARTTTARVTAKQLPPSIRENEEGRAWKEATVHDDSSQRGASLRHSCTEPGSPQPGSRTT